MFCGAKLLKKTMYASARVTFRHFRQFFHIFVHLRKQANFMRIYQNTCQKRFILAKYLHI